MYGLVLNDIYIFLFFIFKVFCLCNKYNIIYFISDIKDILFNNFLKYIFIKWFIFLLLRILFSCLVKFIKK